MAEEMKEEFVPRLNEFIELIKDVHVAQANHIVELGNWLTHLEREFKVLTFEAQANDLYTKQVGQVYDGKTDLHLLKCKEFEKHIIAFRSFFQEHIKQSNYQLGMFSTHWGGYIEKLAVDYFLNFLRKDYGVHTWYQKYKKYFGKAKNVEVDLLALSDTHNYVIEVKNQLNSDALKQINTIVAKLKEHCPDLQGRTFQPMVFCMHVPDESILETLDWGDIWIMKYNGFEQNNAQDTWEWLN